MNKNTIEYLAYLLNKAHKEKGREKAIVFLGAGTSVSAGIPLTNVIVRHIKKKFRNNPIIKEFTKKGEDDYYKLMGALTADERRDLFHFYVTRKRVKLNITNIYLAQLLKLGYVDYIVTVNFDDLILKACTLYNFLPPVYDISNIKTITTTDIRKNSVIYLHGQYFGQWLLNNPDELQKVEDEVLRLFNAIKTRRTWIVVGYSGNDGIFDKIKSLGSFSSELFWVKKKLDEKYDEKIINFLQTENLNANKIEGYYADSFFLKLHTELSKLDEDLKAPEIISKPFTFVKSVLQSINEIKEDDELNDNVKKMLTNCNERIDRVINEYEDEGTEENLKQRIVDAIIKGDFNENLALSFESEIKTKGYKDILELSWYYNSWGITLSNLARKDNNGALFRESIEKYKRASEISPKDSMVFNNWGNALLGLAREQNNESLFKESFKKYKKASELDPKKATVFNNWGNALLGLAIEKKDKILFKESIKKYKMASDISPKDSIVFNNWGNALLGLARVQDDEALFKESIEKYKQSSELDSNNADVYNNWGNALLALGRKQNNDVLIKESIEKYKQSSKLDPSKSDVFNNWGNALSELGKKQNDEVLFKQSFEKYKQSSKLDPKNGDVLNNWGTALSDLGEKQNNETSLIESFEKFKKASELNPKKAIFFNNWGTALSHLGKKQNNETLFKESFEKFKEASDLDPNDADVFNNWGYALIELGKLLNDKKYYKKALKTSKKGYDLGGDPYNISCAYSQLSDKENALKYLKETLDKNFITIEHINEDDDWDTLRNDQDFIDLINQYR